jgi:uncharacterized protein YbjQ (UPF0145 family)
MMRILALLSLAFFAVNCASFGQANLPPKTEFFVTTGDLATKDYQPVALLESRRILCTPCGMTLESAYTSLEESLKKDLIDKAKAAGANGIIELHFQVVPMSGLSSIQAAGLAVRY